MGEIKMNDLQEVKNSAIENYQSIKPETDMKVQEARNTWDSFFNNYTDDLKSEGLKEGNEDRNSNLKGETGSQETGNELKSQGEMNRTKEENVLLQKLSSGELDGLVGDVIFTTGKSSVWTEIKDGNPVRYKQGPGGKFFDGNENVRYEGVKHTLEEWKTDDEKLAFLQKFGWLIENDEVKNYSSKFKPEN